MKDKPKPREKLESLWGEIARMEAEVHDPEEVATSVYNLKELKEIRAKAEAKRAAKREKVEPEPPKPEEKVVDPPPLPDRDQHDDPTAIAIVDDAVLAARRRVENAETDLSVPEDILPEPEVSADVARVEPEDDPEVATPTFDRGELAGVEESPDEPIADPPSVGNPLQTPERPPDLGELYVHEDNVEMVNPRAQPRAARVRTVATFVILVLIGFFLGYLVVAALRLN